MLKISKRVIIKKESMKIFNKTIATLFITSSVIWISSCENRKATSGGSTDSTATASQKYACPMHPEVTGKEGDTCPSCGMKLELVSTEKEENKNEYFMAFKTSPEVEAGKPATLSFTPSIKGKENESVPLDIQHDKKIHLIVVSKDLSYFDHVHPALQANGSYEINVLGKGDNYTNGKFKNETHFDQGGDYVLFADYLPTGAEHQLERIELKISGTPYKAQRFSAEKTESQVDGYEVSLLPDGGKFFSEGTSHISAVIKKDGKEIAADQLEDYLSAKAHVVMISEDSQNYLHVHPNVTKGRLDLHTTFGKPGIFRAWLQFQTNGQVHTADFVILVQQGAVSGEQPAEHHH